MPPEMSMTSDSDRESVISLKDIAAKVRRSSTGPKYACSWDGCGASFMRLDHLDRHEFKHTGIKKHTCTYEGCEKAYTILTHLKRHLRTTHERAEPPQKNVPCTIEGCEQMFQSASNVQRHIREVHENPKVYHCTHCGEKFTQKLKMRRHEIQKHTGDYPHTCTKCGKGFYQQWQHERHIAVCKIYHCPNCAQQFDKWSLYLKHCKETQHGRKYYKCDYCDRVYAKPGELQKHIAAKHLGEVARPTCKCPHEGCDRAYAYARNLKQHIRTSHTGTRFTCTAADCTRIFSSSQNLTKHMERDHQSSVASRVEQTGVKQLKAARKKRKDAGKPTISNLAKLSGLAVDREFDKLLRDRESTALATVSSSLSQEIHTTDEGSEVEMNEATTLTGIAQKDENLRIDTLLEIALQDE